MALVSRVVPVSGEQGAPLGVRRGCSGGQEEGHLGGDMEDSPERGELTQTGVILAGWW